MSQHDMDIANGSGATFRADLNSALLALASCSSGATAPSTTFAYQYWADTANDLLKQRNAANTAWVSVMKLSTGAALVATTQSVGVRSASIATMQSFADEFGASLSASGYQKLSSGLIIQWGLATSGAGGNVTVTFPIAFPTSILRAYASCPQGNIVGGVGAATNTTLQIGATFANTAGGAVGYSIPWFSLGY